jgi:hypothetical protein
VLDRWPDGSVRWALVDFQADVLGGATVSLSPHVGTPAPTARPMAESEADRIIVRTGVAEFVIAAGSFPLQAVSVNGRTALDTTSSGLVVIDSAGQRCETTLTAPQLVTNGPLRTMIRLNGVARSRRLRLECVCWMHFFADMGAVKFEVLLKNPRPAIHKGGFWELGDRGSVFVKDVAVRFVLPAASERPIIRCSETEGFDLRVYNSPVALYQDSSGGDRWQSSAHVDNAGRIPVSFRGYTLSAGGHESKGLRATPIVQVERGDARLSVTMERFWENFPKAIAAAEDGITLQLFPSEGGKLHEVQGGEQKTHSFWMSVADDAVSEVAFDWCRIPSRAVPSPRWCCSAGVVPFLTTRDDDPHAPYLELVDNAIHGIDSFVAKREAIDEYGWRHFGEIYADHEAVVAQGERRLVSHYNNQYDAVAGLAYQFLRSGNPMWWTLMDDLARHVVDIDIYHTDQDWPKYNHGLFWHTVHYKDAGKSTHRTYPRTTGVHGGGPSAGHLYTTGLMLHHFLTGSPQSRDAVIELATFVIDCDDGRKSVFKWLDRGRTGLATASGTADYHGPGRAAGNALNALIDAHSLTGEDRFLDKAEEVIRRCVHPRDDIDSRELLDVERRWFYTMFLQSLGKYLLHKRRIGQLDVAYAYGRASLLAYARWMDRHERPYLDHPEILEFPTETWAAQDMRKSEVFQWASLHARGEERERFLERAASFFDYSIRTLSTMATKTLARPMVLLLSHGWSHSAFVKGIPNPEPDVSVAHDFGAPQAFVPQKTRAVRKAKIVGTAAGIGVLAWVWLLLNRLIF